VVIGNMTLTRKQLERIITIIGINGRVESVTIEERHDSGIGLAHWITCHCADKSQDFSTDITDVSTW
jgi:hypothetical protein